MSTEIVYQDVKSDDISLAMGNSAKSTRLSGQVKTADLVVWGQTVTAIMERVDMEKIVLDTSKDGISLIGEQLKKLMGNHIIATQTIPAKGKNRQNKEFDVCDKDGVPKWSSWADTRRIWAYIGDIAKILSYGLDGELYPETLKVGGRGTLLAACKTPEGYMKAIERLSEALQDNLDLVDNPVEVQTAHLKVSALSVNDLSPVDEMRQLVSKLDALLGVVDEAEKQAVLHDIGRLSAHFSAE